MAGKEVFIHDIVITQKPYLHDLVLHAGEAGHGRVVGEEVGDEYEEGEEVVHPAEGVDDDVVLLEVYHGGGAETATRGQCHQRNVTPW